MNRDSANSAKHSFRSIQLFCFKILTGTILFIDLSFKPKFHYVDFPRREVSVKVADGDHGSCEHKP